MPVKEGIIWKKVICTLFALISFLSLKHLTSSNRIYSLLFITDVMYIECMYVYAYMYIDVETFGV